MDDETCMKCHQSGLLSKTLKSGAKKSLFIDLNSLRKSVHKSVPCIGCHKNAKDYPHEKDPGSKCESCHEIQQKEYSNSAHGRLYIAKDPDVPGCSTCHGSHNIISSKNSDSPTFPLNLIKVCLSCHADERIERRHKLPGAEVIKAYEKSVHGMAATRLGLTVSAICNDCHGSHDIRPADDPRSLRNKINIPIICARCHPSIYDKYKESVHGKAIQAGIAEAPVCTDCHGEHTIYIATDPKSRIAPKNIPKTCSSCHEEKSIIGKFNLPGRRLETYEASYHGIVNKYGRAVAANCTSCHGFHDIRPSNDKKSSIHPEKLPETCGKCHPGVTKMVAQGKIHIEKSSEQDIKSTYYITVIYSIIEKFLSFFVAGYIIIDLIGRFRERKMKKLILILFFGILSISGNAYSLTLTDCLKCHQDQKMVKNIININEFRQSIHKNLNCTDCHKDIKKIPHEVKIENALCFPCHDKEINDYKTSVHGRQYIKGDKDVPSCRDCHGRHDIKKVKDSESKVSEKNIPKTCSTCHESANITGRFGLATKRLQTYEDSYHGIANKFGKPVVANCASCHGFHDIRPSKDPESSINPSNLPATCGKCHPGAGENFAKGKIHIEATKESAIGVYIVRKFYTYFIGFLMIIFLTYMTLDFIGYRKRKGRS